ncbi:MAG: indole-3-glycerol phosphate synthase TrpC [Ignavibacteriae bacterium]|nr:MAG: indole-3-glycerol phosphate synthase TrpC [Ignavibacteriota bacterium]
MNILEEILEQKRYEIATAVKSVPVERLRSMPGYARTCCSLQNALTGKKPAVIAEIKKASPSKKVIREDFHPLTIAGEYVKGGASALSVLTDKKYFQGDIQFIADIRAAVPIPILRKDFILDSYQLEEAKAFGADAVLLIASALPPERLRDLYQEATALGLECLVEVHKIKELNILNYVPATIIGVNNRNLSNFSVDLTTTIRVASRIPKDIIVVSESGISSKTDIDHLSAHGIDAVLVGESLMRSPNPGEALRVLMNSSKDNIH